MKNSPLALGFLGFLAFMDRMGKPRRGEDRAGEGDLDTWLMEVTSQWCLQKEMPRTAEKVDLELAAMRAGTGGEWALGSWCLGGRRLARNDQSYRRGMAVV